MTIQKNTGVLDKALLLTSGIMTLTILSWVLYYCHFGFDLTDESFDIVWISNPFLYSLSLTQFGFIYHPLYALFHGNLILLRQANILITFSTAFSVCYLYIHQRFGDNLSSIQQKIISSALALTSLVFLTVWVPTPNYNGLTLQAMCILVSGLLFTQPNSKKMIDLGAILIGIGGWLCFMAKPSTAVGLSVITLFYLIFSKKFDYRKLLISAVVAGILLIMSAMIIDGSVITFIKRLTDNFQILELLKSGHNLQHILRIDPFILDEKTRDVLYGSILVFFISMVLFQSTFKLGRFFGYFFIITGVLLAVLMLTNFIEPDFFNEQQGNILLAIPLGALFAALVIHRIKLFSFFSKEDFALFIMFIFLPFIFALGSNNNLWFQASLAGIFWILAGSMLIPKKQQRLLPLLGFTLSAQILTLFLIQTGLSYAYRQPDAIKNYTDTFPIHNTSSQLYLSNDFVRYFTEMKSLAEHAGLHKNMPMIDLTGRAPGTLYVLNAKNVGQPWLIGGYPGSDQYTIALLKKVPCDILVSSWLLTEPKGVRAISADVLSSFGANLESDYDNVGSINAIKVEYSNKNYYQQNILRPKNNNHVLKACMKIREN